VATRSGQELDMTRLTVIVLFLIVDVIFVRMFFHNYVSEPARAASLWMDRAETYRTRGVLPDLPLDGPRNPYYERAQLMRKYVMTGDEQAKQQIIQNAKRRERAKHALAIWGSLVMVCISTIAVVGAGLPMLQEWLWERRYRA